MSRECSVSTAVIVLLASCLAGAQPASALETKAPVPSERLSASSPDDVMASLRRALAWYQEARIAMQAARGALAASFDRGEEQTVRRTLQRAFDAAQARAAVLSQEDRPDSPEAPSGARRAGRQAALRATIQQAESDVARLRARLRDSTAAARPALERELAAASNRLELGRVQLDFVTKLGQLGGADPGEDADLEHQIQALQGSVPELGSPEATASVVTTTSPAASWPSGAWALVYRLLALQRARGSVQGLARSTADVVRDTDAEIRATQQTVRPLVSRLRALAKDPAADGAALAAGQREFRDLLERVRLRGAVMLALREESALLHRYSGDVQATADTFDREISHVLRGLAMQLVGVVLALATIMLGAVLWRVAVARYVANPYHRRLLLTARQVVVVMAITLVLVFHFATELTALVAALGFVAAGIAFALQNVILAVAGYFSMAAPNGIRVGDRVSLQGPFGYVHGEVVEIGVVRTRLRELAGDPLQPTGRIIICPNSVAFTGSFIKHPSTPSPEPRHA
jgi:hypothetical protein